ncbi:helix-turn-helix transcriptional regulator [Dactylosporangium cerinum]|uniref:Helix-turn-helix transcriptional regulator n=1 Tax=Dactylosporangium cerinum TaxID=1434730 RepID=A0ABV9W9U0_9ACTN
MQNTTLTGAEINVLHMLVGFLTVNEIAAELDLSPNTVKTHLARPSVSGGPDATGC